MKHAETYEEINPLIDLCKEGRVFDAQAWIAACKPLDLPSRPEKGPYKHSPLDWAIESGCHSMVQVLLEAGVEVEQSDHYCALLHAVTKKRLDLIELLVRHGADVRLVDMRDVFNTWNFKIIDYFVDHGVDLIKDDSLAEALCDRNRKALGVCKGYQVRSPEFQRQLDLALDYHCEKGNKKWVSLLLWAGADPYGNVASDSELADWPDSYSCPIMSAIINGHLDILRIKKMLRNPLHPHSINILRYACFFHDPRFVELLVKSGYQVNDLPDGTSSLISDIYGSLPTKLYPDQLKGPVCGMDGQLYIDHYAIDQKAKILVLLLEHGAKWRLTDKIDVRYMRRKMKKMNPTTTLEFVQLMVKYKACERASMEELFRTPVLRLHVTKVYGQILDLIEQLPDKISTQSVLSNSKTEDKQQAGN